MHTTQSLGTREGGDESLVTRKIVNEFWSMAQDETLAVLRSNCVSEHILFRSKMANNLLPKWFLSLFPISHFKQSFAMLPEGYFINLISDTIRFVNVLQLQSSCSDYYLLLKIKQFVVWFCSTLRVSNPRTGAPKMCYYLCLYIGIWL